MLPKSELRALMLARLRAMPADERRERSERLVARLREDPDWDRAQTVALFAPLRSEPLLDLLWTVPGALAGKMVAYPRVESSVLTLRVIHGPDSLQAEKGSVLREPPADAPLLAGWPDLILVPGLAFSAAGERLGRGGGFYDRLLAQAIPAGCRSIGAGFQFQVVNQLPVERHDVPLSAILTD